MWDLSSDWRKASKVDKQGLRSFAPDAIVLDD